MKKIISIILVLIYVLIIKDESFAFEKASASSAKIIPVIEMEKEDKRAEILEKYLESLGSPMSSSAKTFVSEADKYGLDWKLVVSIAGNESYFGKLIPVGSFNAWGWGVYGSNVIYFESWDHGIKTISKALKENYVDRGAEDIYSIGRIYAEDPAWAYKIGRFISEIEAFERSYNEPKVLSISL